MRNLRKTDGITDRLKKAIESLMFVLDLEQPIESHHEGGQKHVMLSYNWEVQSVMLKVGSTPFTMMIFMKFTLNCTGAHGQYYNV